MTDANQKMYGNMSDPRFHAGGNQPPDMAVTADGAATDLSAWLSENPTIEDEDKAREAKKLIDRGKLTIKDLEDERTAKVSPLNEKVKEINSFYRPARDALERIIMELSRRVSTFLQTEERKRIAAANEARRIAEEAERVAREAESAEQAAIESANSGVLDVNIKATVVAADDAFRAYEKATRQAEVAEKDTVVRLGGGFRRAIGLKDKETLIVESPIKAITHIGVTEDIRQAIIKGARAYRKLHGVLPEGVIAETERGI